ncbi:hypothetical protein GCM10009819_17210 [Agromyces tropicus]|uniref:DUF5671 domain-containing protein n=1 Tax=Agromyces tropicus TaxID=555371 RepID=A0ABN2UCN9_9MICO
MSAATGTAAAPGGAGPGSAQGTVRRLIVFVLLFVLVTIAAIGIAGLVERLLGAARDLAVAGTADLALQLAFTLIGGPLAALLWWASWRRMADPAERGSVAWGLYLAAMGTVSLVVATSALAGTVTSLVDGRWEPEALAVAIVWALVWVWHRWMLRHPAKGPTRLATVPLVLGAAYGLVVGAGGVVVAVGAVLDAAFGTPTLAILVPDPWWYAALDGLTWAVIGGAIWWWHWVHDGVRRIPTAFAAVALVVVGVLGGAAAALAGAGTALDVGLRLAFDPADGTAAILEPLGTALAAAAVGAFVWRLHARIADAHSEATRRASRLVVAGLGLAGAASGIGVVVNAVLAAVADPLASTGTRTLLLGGISTLVVGGPTWWLAWRPTRRVDPAEAADVGRRVYLVAVFGASAVVAIVALLVVGYRLFEFVLDPVTGAALVDRIRAPLGLLVATALVFAYHFAVWRRDRVAIAEAGIATGRAIGRVVLVAPGDPSPFVRAVSEATGAPVTAWPRVPAEGETPPDVDRVVGALQGVSGRRVLVLAGPGDRVEVVPLAE